MASTKYRIVPKRDFGGGNGYWMAGAGNSGTLNYGWVKRGFVVTDGRCNIMPGATWFRSVADAMRGLRIYIETNGDADAFWDRVRTSHGAGNRVVA